MLYHHRGDSRTRTVYSNTFSEENGGYSGRMNGPIRAIKCSGGYCDNKRLVAVQHGYKKAVVPSNNPYWTSWFSQEGKKDARNKRTCPDDMVVNQIQCKGAYCDKMRLGCGVMASGYRVSHEHTMETGFFSEEQGEEQCDDGYYIYGIECSGSYCDNIKLYCARIQYLYKPPKKSVSNFFSFSFFNNDLRSTLLLTDHSFYLKCCSGRHSTIMIVDSLIHVGLAKRMVDTRAVKSRPLLELSAVAATVTIKVLLPLISRVKLL